MEKSNSRLSVAFQQKMKDFSRLDTFYLGVKKHRTTKKLALRCLSRQCVLSVNRKVGLGESASFVVQKQTQILSTSCLVGKPHQYDWRIYKEVFNLNLISEP